MINYYLKYNFVKNNSLNKKYEYILTFFLNKMTCDILFYTR